jgi:hypothetical protein
MSPGAAAGISCVYSRSMSDGKRGPPPKPPIRERDLVGFQFFPMLASLLERLHEVAADPKRKLFCDQYVSLLLFYFFNPTLTSLRGIQKTTGLSKVQKKLGVRPTSLGSLSEAARVFDAGFLETIVQELAVQARPLGLDTRLESVKQVLTAVDGTLLPALPRMAWALWCDAEHRAAKAHVHFEILKGIPVRADITAGSTGERAVLRQALQAGRLYVVDRGYAEYALFQEIVDAGSSFVGRVVSNVVAETIEERPLNDEARAAGVIRDRVVRLGCEPKREDLRNPVRLVEVSIRKNGEETILLLVTDRLDLAADLVALIYQCRWHVELFFRWLKCVLGCRHLLSDSQNGVTLQVYAAIIASLLISVGTGLKPTKRTYEMICLYFQGWATEEELLAHIQGRAAQEANSKIA